MTESTECVMALIENSDFSFSYECSACKTLFKATAKFEKSKVCPNCKASIKYFEEYDNDAKNYNDGGVL